MERMDNSIEVTKIVNWQEIDKFNPEQQQEELDNINKRKAKSKEENEEKITQLKLQLEIESFLDTLKNNNWLINFDSMEQIWHWGTHYVFNPDKSGKFIVKINNTVYNESLKGNKNWILNENSRKMANGFINDRNNKFDALYKSFWVENCLYERLKLVKIQYKGKIVECPIVIQEKSELYKKEHICFPAQYIERVSNKDKNLYEMLNNILLTNTLKINKTQEIDNFMSKNNTKLKEFIDNIYNDKNLKNKVEEFLDKIKNHYENTWEIIDLVGNDNVMFYQEWENRDFKIWSVIKNTWEKELGNVLNTLEKNPEALTRNNPTRKHLNNLLAYTRILNYLWIKLGKWKIINLNLNETQIKNLNALWI